MKLFEFTDKTKRLIANLDLLIGHLDTYVDNNYELKDEEIEEINDSIAVIRSAIFDLQDVEHKYELCDAERQANMKGYLKELHRKDKALEEACDLLNDEYDCPAESISNCDICGDLNCEKRCHEHIDSRECWRIWLMEYARKMG